MQRRNLLFAAGPVLGASLFVTALIVVFGAAAAEATPQRAVTGGQPAPVTVTRGDTGDSAGGNFVSLFVNESGSWVAGQVSPTGATLTFTLWRAGTLLEARSQTSAPNGEFYVSGWRDQTSFQVGDVLKVDSDIGVTSSVFLLPMSGAVNVVSNMISGHVEVPTCPTQVRGELWNGSGAAVMADTDAHCNYTLDFGTTDIRLADTVAVIYKPDANQIAITRNALQVQVDLDDDRISGNTTPGETVQITVTRGAASFARLTSAERNGSFNLPVDGMDLRGGEVVTISTAASRITVYTPPTLTVQLDPDADTISGYGPPNATLHAHISDRPIGDFNLQTDNTGYYSCTTNLPPNGFDLLPSDWGWIGVEDANSALVTTNFGTVDLGLDMNALGGGQAAPGGRFIYELHYRTFGRPAEGIVITDTLPASVTYVSNNGGYPATVIGNQVVITTGRLSADNDRWLQLVVAIGDSLTAGGSVHNVADIGARQVDNNPGNNSAFFDMQLATNDADVMVGHFPHTGDPVPGQQLIYQINYNNGGNTGSGGVLLTDTLPLSTTFITWWADEPGWTLVQTGTQTVWQRDAIGGHQGSTLYLLVQLDPALGMNQQLHNTVTIDSPNDTNHGNNVNWSDAWTSPSRRNVSIYKTFDSGSTVPGMQVQYGLSYNNEGNMAAHHVLLTDTLPPGMAFVEAGNGGPNGWVTMPYSYHVGNTFVWDLGMLAPGAYGHFQVHAQINTSTHAGTILTNTARISASDGDAYPNDNTSNLVVTVRPSGPNLVVYGDQVQWNGPEQVEYPIRIQNRGNVPVTEVWLTDTHPSSTSFGRWWPEWMPGGTNMTATTAPAQSVFWLNRLNSGDAVGIRLQVNLDSGLGQQPGLLFTNMVRTIVPQGETNPSDNAYTDVTYTGPDLYVQNRLADGVPGAGKLITYQLVYGNRSDHWGTSSNYAWLVDQLPDGAAYVSSDVTPDIVLGNNLVWIQNGGLGGNWRNAIQVTVRITDTAKPGDTFISTAAFHDSPASIEAITDNNTQQAVVSIAALKAFVPRAIR